METFYLHQAILDQRAVAALFDSTFVEVKQTLVGCPNALKLCLLMYCMLNYCTVSAAGMRPLPESQVQDQGI